MTEMLPQGCPDHPRSGHRFRIQVAMTGASCIKGKNDPEPHSYRDSGHETAFDEVVVRASSLEQALLVAAMLPLPVWFPRGHFDEDPE